MEVAEIFIRLCKKTIDLLPVSSYFIASFEPSFELAIISSNRGTQLLVLKSQSLNQSMLLSN